MGRDLLGDKHGGALVDPSLVGWLEGNRGPGSQCRRMGVTARSWYPILTCFLTHLPSCPAQIAENEKPGVRRERFILPPYMKLTWFDGESCPGPLPEFSAKGRRPQLAHQNRK